MIATKFCSTRYDRPRHGAKPVLRRPACLALREGTLVPVGLRASILGLWNSLHCVSQKTLIGDAVAPGIIQAAIFSSHKAARKFLNNGVEPEIKRERGLLV